MISKLAPLRLVQRVVARRLTGLGDETVLRVHLSRRGGVTLAITGVLFGIGLIPATSAVASPSTGSISGVVIDASDQPIIGACVEAQSSSGFGFQETASDGTYTLTNLQPGSYTVSFDADCGPTPYVEQWFNDEPDFQDADPVSVVAGSDAGSVDAQLTLGGTISGTVTDAGTGDPLASVCVSPEALNPFRPFPGTTTASDGTYTIEGLPTGSYQLFLSDCSGGDYIGRSYPGNSPNSLIAVTAGSATTGVDVGMTLGGQIKGAVDDPNGDPLAGACVDSSAASGFASAETGSDGTYTLHGVAPGANTVEFFPCGSNPDYITQYYDNAPSFNNATPVSVVVGAPTTGIDATFVLGGSLSGTVTDTAGNPAQGVCAELVDTNGEFTGVSTALTDVNGKYTIHAVPDGSYKLDFTNCGSGDYLSQWYRGQTDESSAGVIVVKSGANTPGINAKLADGGSIGGTVTDTSGKPIDGVCVAALKSDGTFQFAGNGTTDAKGRYTIHSLPAGSYVVEYASCGFFFSSGYVSQFYNDQPSEGSANPVSVIVGQETTGIDAQLSAGGTVTGTVTDSGGAPLADICVSGFPDPSNTGPSFDAFTETDGHGQYTLTGMGPGSDDVSFDDCSGSDFLSQAYQADPITVSDGTTVPGVDATMTKGGSISGALTLSTGVPAVNECAEAFDSSMAVAAADQTDGAGDYALHSLPPGTYRVGFTSVPCDFDGADLTQWYHGATSYDTADALAVTAGNDMSGVDDVVAPPTGGGGGGGLSNNLSASISSTPDAGSQPLDATITATVDDSDQSDLVYTVDFGDGSATVSGASSSPYSPIVLSHTFAHKGTYKVSVSASDPVGNTASASTLVDVNPALPSAPLSVFASPDDREASVFWQPPASDGGDTITGYTVTANPGGATATVNGSTFNADVTGLTNGTQYTFTVAATNDVGTGPESAPSNAVTPRGPTTTALSASPDPAVYSNDILLTATVQKASDAPGAPTGTVDFFDDNALIGSGTLGADGTATVDATSLAEGDHTLTAEYAGDSAFTPSTSSQLDEQVVKAATTTSLSASPPAPVFGQAVTLTATVASATAGVTAAPAGTVEFAEGSTELGEAMLDGQGTASIQVSSLALGSHLVTAMYDGDQAFAPSTSASTQVTISQASTSTALSASPQVVTVGDTTNLTALVEAAAPGAGTPTGSVTYTEDGAAIGSAALTAQPFTTGPLTAGDHVFVATYSGDSDFKTSTSAPVTVVVTANNHNGGGSDSSKYPGGGGSLGGGGGFGGSGGGSTGGGTCYSSCAPGTAVTWAHIHTAGPITDIWISDDLECAFRHEGDAYPAVFTGLSPYGPAPYGLDAFPGAAACGTLANEGGTLYGPGVLPDGPSTSPYAPVRQSTVTGSGTSADPYTIVTVVRAGSDLQLTQTDTYVVGAEKFRTSIAVANIGAADSSPTISRAFDCYLSDWDSGYGAYVSGGPACRDTTGAQSTPGDRLLDLDSSSLGASFVEGKFSDVWNELQSGGALPDSTACTYNDDAEAQAWQPTLQASQSAVLDSAVTYDAGPPTSADCHAGGTGPAPGNAPARTDQGGPTSPSELAVNCSTPKPVNCATGDFWHTFTDFVVPGRGPNLDLTRTYDAQTAASDGPFGHGWADSYAMSASTDGSGDVTIHEESGTQVTFTDSGGTFTAPPRVLATLVPNAGGYDFTREHSQITYHFDGTGRLITEADLNGDTTTLSYSDGHLATVSDAAGRTLTFGYSGGRVATVTDPLSRVESFTYSAAGDLVGMSDPRGGTWTFAYDAGHLMTSFTDPDGGTVTNTYDGSNRVTQQVDAAGNTTTLSYAGDSSSDAGGSTTITDPHGNVTRYEYVDLELLSETRALGTARAATTTYSYDPGTLGVTQVTDPIGNSSTYTYDARGNRLTTTDGLGNATSSTYNDLDELTSSTSPLGETTRYSYDTHGNLLSVTDPLGQSTTYGRADFTHAGDVTSVTDADGRVTSLTYDADGDVMTTAVQPSAGVTDTTAYGYNADGEQTCVVSAVARAAGAVCPAGGASPASGVETLTYNADGLLTRAVDGVGGVTTYLRDADGNVTRLTDPDGHVTTTAYDLDDRVVSTTAGADGSSPSSTTYAYDLSPGSGACPLVSGATYCTTTTDAAGHATADFFNALDELIEETRPGSHHTEYTYDAAGNRLSTVNTSGNSTAFEYDANNRLVSIKYSNGSAPEVTYDYNADDERVAMTDGTGTTQYSYDSDGRLVSRTNGAGSAVGYAYDAVGDVTGLTYPNGRTVTRTFNGADRLVAVTDWNGGQTSFSYDADGHVARTTYPNGDDIDSTYDGSGALIATAASRISDGTVLASLAESRDANSQLASESAGGSISGTTGYVYNAKNELTSAGGVNYAYNAVGDPTQLGAAVQSFDSANELTSSIVAGGTSTTYGYDADGRRITDTTPVGYVYDGAGRLIMVNAGGGGSSSGGGGGSSGGGGGSSGGGGGPTPTGTPTPTSSPSPSASPTPTTSPTPTSASPTPSRGPASTPVVSKIGPGFGAARGGTVVTIVGSGFTGVEGVSFGSVSSKRFTVVSPTRIQAVAPGGRGIIVVRVTTQGGTSQQTTGAEFRYVAGVPVITGLSPHHGPRRGGTKVVIHGRNFVPNAKVKFGGAIAKVSVASDRTIVAIEPRGRGTVHARVITVYGRSRHSRANRFVYRNASHSGGVQLSATRAHLRPRAAASASSSYSYDGDGLRATETTSGFTTNFVWDVTSGLPTLLDDGIDSYIYGPGGTVVEQVADDGGSSDYFFTDSLGSTRALLGSDGSVTATYTYDAYGSTVSHTGSAATPIEFAGGYLDASSGLYYLINRYYDPETGQFISVDPLVRLTAQPYDYGRGNPVGLTDKDGLWAVATCDFVQASVGAGPNGGVGVESCNWWSPGWSAVTATPVVFGGVGAGGGVTGGASVQYSSAKSPKDLEGPGCSIGASGQVGIGLEGSVGSSCKGRGFSAEFGATLGADAHVSGGVQIGYTAVIESSTGYATGVGSAANAGSTAAGILAYLSATTALNDQFGCGIPGLTYSTPPAGLSVDSVGN